MLPISGLLQRLHTLGDSLSYEHKSLDSRMSVPVQLMRHCPHALVHDPVAVLGTASSRRRCGAKALQAECPVFLLLLPSLQQQVPIMHECMHAKVPPYEIDLTHLLSTSNKAFLYDAAGFRPSWLCYVRLRTCLMVRHAGNYGEYLPLGFTSDPSYWIEYSPMSL